MSQIRNQTQKKINNHKYDILKLLNKKEKNEFVSISEIPGKIQFKQKINNKTINQSQMIFEISNNNFPDIFITSSSIKADYIVTDKYGNNYYVETKSINNNVLSELYNITKTKRGIKNFIDLCKDKNSEPNIVFEKFKNNFLKHKESYLELVYDKLPDFFVFHDKSEIKDFISKEEFLKKYKLDLIIKKDAGGDKKYKFDRPTIIYKEI